MNKFIFSIILLLVGLLSLAQKKLPTSSQPTTPEFGVPTKDELLLKECSFEADAPAMVLFKEEITEVMNRYVLNLRTDVRKRVKIFNSKGFQFGSLEIPYSKRNRIKNLEAYVYNIDDDGNIKITKVESDEIFKQPDSKKKGSLIFTFPGLRPGSVIEYRFTEVEPDADAYRVKFLQEDIPVQLCIQKMIYHENIRLQLSFSGLTERNEDKPAADTPLKDLFTRTIMREHIPAFKFEPMMSSQIDNYQALHLIFSDEDVVNTSTRKAAIPENNLDSILWLYSCSNLTYHRYFGQQTVVTVEALGSIIDSAKRISNKNDQIEFVYNRIKRSVKWNEEQGIYARSVEEAGKNGTGSSAEINLLLLNALKQLSIDCYPILVRAREYGRVDRKLYSLGQFNNVNVLILDGVNYFVLDATKKDLSYKTPPKEILNRDVLLIDKISSKWLTIIDDRPFLKNHISINGRIDSSGNITGDAFISYFDYYKKNQLLQKEKKKENADDKEFFIKEGDDVRIDSLKEENIDDDKKPLNQYFNFTYSPESTGNFFFINPFFLSPFRKNPFSDSLRRTDIDMGSSQLYTLNMRLAIPDKFIPEDLPVNILIRSEDSSMLCKREIIKGNNVLIFRHSFEIKRAIFSKDEYPVVREFLRKVYAASKEQIILKLEN